MAYDFKNASEEERKAEYRRIAQETGESRFLEKKELGYLPGLLGEGEPLLAFSSGVIHGKRWLMVLTDRRILLLRKPWVGALRQKAIDLEQVHALSGETGLFSSRLYIQDGPAIHVIEGVWSSSVLPFTEKARTLIEDRLAMQKEGLSLSGSGEDKVEKLDKLARLVEKGFLTREEFMVEKEKMLRQEF